MESSITIIDKEKTKVSPEANIRLLWAALIMCESVNSCCEPTQLLNLVLEFDTLPEKMKFSLYVLMNKKNPEVSDENIKAMETYYAQLASSRKMKGKNQAFIVLQMQGEKWIKNCLHDYKSWVIDTCAFHKIDPLIPLTTTDMEKWDKPLLIFHFPHQDTEKRNRERIVFFSGAVTDLCQFPLFDSMICKLFNHDEFNVVKTEGYINKFLQFFNGGESKDINNSSVHFISDFLFEMPEPFGLTASQIHLVRNDFSKTSWKLFEEMKKMNEEMKEIPFGQASIEKLVTMYNSRVGPFKPLLQKTVDENPCFAQLKNENPKGKVYRIHAGISSYANIIDFYKELDIINTSEVMYIREHMAETMNINNSRLFLFLETV